MGLLALLQWLLGCLCGWKRRAPHADGLSKPRYRDEEAQQDEDTSSEHSSSGSDGGGSGASPTGAPTACRARPTLLSPDRWRRRPTLPTVGEGVGGSSAGASAPAAADGHGGGSCHVDIARLERDRARGHPDGSSEAAETREQLSARRSRSAPMKLRNVGSLQQQLQQYEAESSTGRGEPDLGADMAAMCRGASSGGGGGGSARASRHRPRAALPGRWLQSSDVQTMAAELGLDLVARPRDAELLWIAEEALAAAEPQGWSREKALDLDGREVVVFEHWASGEQLPEHPVRTHYKELVQRTRRERRRGYHASAAGSGQPPPPPGTLKQARLQAVQGALAGELGAAVRWLGWGETSNVCEILLNAVKPKVPRALRGELSVRLGAPPHCAPRCDMALGLSLTGAEGRPLYCLSAFRHLGGLGGTSPRRVDPSGGELAAAPSPSHVTGHYTLRLEPHDGQVAGAEESAFCGKLLCGLTGRDGGGGDRSGGQGDGSQFVFCDDPANFYGWPRELGAVVVRGGERGHVHVLLPRVQPGGGTAQFRVLRPQDGMLAKFRRGDDVQHMMSLQGHLVAHRSKLEGSHAEHVSSWSLKLFSETHNSVVFAFRWREPEAMPEAAADCHAASPTGASTAAAAAPSDPYGPAVEMSFAHPLSPYQAGSLALALSHHLQFEMHRPGRGQRASSP